MKGSWNLGGDFDLSKTTPKNWWDVEESRFTSSLTIKYFLFDQFSAGLESEINSFKSWYGRITTASAGPSFTFYFGVFDKLVTQMSTGFLLGLTESANQSTIFVKLGAEYFITPSVSVGPSIYFKHHHDNSVSFNSYGASGGLNFYF